MQRTRRSATAVAPPEQRMLALLVGPTWKSLVICCSNVSLWIRMSGGTQQAEFLTNRSSQSSTDTVRMHEGRRLLGGGEGTGHTPSHTLVCTNASKSTTLLQAARQHTHAYTIHVQHFPPF